MAYFFIAMTILLTVFGQLILKWQVGLHGHLLSGPFRLWNVAELVFKPWVFTALAAAFAASLCWMMAIKRLPLSTAYPFTALSFILVLAFSAIVFGEPVNAWKVTGTVMVVIGVIILSLGG